MDSEEQAVPVLLNVLSDILLIKEIGRAHV